MNATAPARGPERPVVFAVRDLPIDAFGGEHGRETRKFVLLVIATHADPDGTHCYPGVGTIAREVGLGHRQARKVITWLREHGFLGIAYKASGLQTNVFTVLIPAEVGNSTVPQELHSSSGTETSEVRNSTVPGGGERRAQGRELYSSPNLPSTNQSPTKEKPTKTRKTSALEFVAPEWVPSKEWADYIDMRKKLHKPLTERAAELAVKELQKLRDAGNAPGDVLDQSILSAWMGLFPLKRDSGKRVAPQRLSEIDYQSSYGMPSGTNVGRL